MKKLLILGAGTAGTMVANKLSHVLSRDEWKITIVDQEETHYYQPGFLFIPFGIYGENDVIKPKRDYIPAGVEMIVSEIELIEPDENRVRIAKDGRMLHYDYLIIATGTHPRPEETPGLTEAEWRHTIHDFYTYEGAVAWPNIYAPGKAASWSSALWNCPTNARWPHWNSSFWQIGTSTSATCVTALN